MITSRLTRLSKKLFSILTGKVKINMKTEPPDTEAKKPSIKSFLKEKIKDYSVFILRLSPQKNLLVSVLIYTFISWLVLSLPFMKKGGATFLDTLFTAAAAVSTTGLSTVNFAEFYSLPAKIFTLILIQVCAIGYMTISSFLYLSLSSRVYAKHRELLSAEFSLPDTINLKEFLWAVMIFTFFVESAGTAVLLSYFIHHGFTPLNALWYAVFHSVSAFCTAGFTLFPNSLESFATSPVINITISVLSLLGGMGFIVVTDIFNRLTRKTRHISYTTKIILATTLFLIVSGTLTVFLTNPHMKNSFMSSFFQAVSAMTTTGFNTVQINIFSMASLLIIMILMCIGASPSGTGGGIRTTTATALWAIVRNQLRKRNRVTFLGRVIPHPRLYAATTTFIFYMFVMLASLFVLVNTEKHPFAALLFETVSALGNVGYSMGITQNLTAAGKIVIILTMLIGRIGVLTFGMAIVSQENKRQPRAKEEDLAI